ncbi:hypothetical protein [Actinomadura parmotrematis]|uniref:Uncharacterized protein n=1 Tax=Actinomadura parmotrematis TaxID=2864039 RepID=A0ABS7FY69_9ACTN|nr:hypothetical protein [Actinomadura parmotrematis]MBW8484614.1 hypothetical protein [Actinomadura parmotrematis]
MMTFLALLVTVAAFGLLGALFGADSRDGRDWAPGSFGERCLRRVTGRSPEIVAEAAPADRPVRTSGSRAPACAGRGAAAHRRPLRAGR